jgi:tetratricopeptide (TPR) repeat protein
MTQRPLIATLLVCLAFGLMSCAWYDNRITYFNTYYNIGRIMTEVQNQFSYHDEGKRVKPRVLVPGMEGFTQTSETTKGNTMQFLQAFVIEQAKLQPVRMKVDSVLIKGSKILANHGASEYVEGTLFNMSKAYFFRSEWVASQQKCVEMVEKFPEGEYAPDGYLLLAKNYLMQRKISQGEVALSKCVDVAWFKERYDIVSEAYRIQAELAIEAGDLEKAVRPYKQAVAQSEDGEQRAKWQVDVASLYFRAGKFDLAEKAFAEVEEYTPDAVATFEARLYRAASLTQLKRFDEAEEIIADMEENRSY